MKRFPNVAAWLLLLGAVTAVFGCTAEGTDIAYPGQDIRMTFLHTTDSHSKILPYRYVPNSWDERLGINRCPAEKLLSDCQSCIGYKREEVGDPEAEINVSGECSDCVFFSRFEELCTDCLSGSYDNAECLACLEDTRSAPSCTDYTYGGAARVAWAIAKERERSLRVAHVDTGDYFQGAPVFNLFAGEPEVRALATMGVDVGVIGNHEFDGGAKRLAEVLFKFAAFPVLNANYMWDAPDDVNSTSLGELVSPFFIRDYNGLKVGYIGMGNLRSLNSLGDADNSMGARALETDQVIATYVPMIRSQVDLVVVLSHLGVHGDVQMAKNNPDIDIIFGGHDHVVIYPPLEIVNPEGETTLVVHSGVNYKCVGRLDIVVRDGKIVGHDYKAIPITSESDADGNSLVGQDPLVAEMMYDYEFELNRAQDLKREIGTARDDFPRKAEGDSPLGNLVADAMRAREKVETDFSITNSLGIRADLDKGAITIEKLYEIFPFENSITTMYMSGTEIQDLFNYVASRTAAYGCAPQVQISGARCVLDCTLGRVKEVEIGGIQIVEDYELLKPYIVFNLATNDYIADGGSGFDIFEQNTTKADTMLSLRDVVIDYIEERREIEPVTDGRISLLH